MEDFSIIIRNKDRERKSEGYAVKKINIVIKLTLLLVALVLLAGCSAKTPQLEFTMITDLNLDGSGTRIFRVQVSQQVLDLAQAKLNDKEATILSTLAQLKPEELVLEQTFLSPNERGNGKYVDFILSFDSIDELQQKLSKLVGKDVRVSLGPITDTTSPSPFETRVRLQEANHMVEYFGWVTDALQMYFRELEYEQASLDDLPVYYEIRVPGKLERSQVGQVQVVFHKQESTWWNKAYQSTLEAFSRQASRFKGSDGVSYSTRGVDLYEVSIIPSDFSTGVLYTEFLARVAVERLFIRTEVLPAPWWHQLFGSHPAGYRREMIVEFPENYRTYIEQHKAEFEAFFNRYLVSGITGTWRESGNKLSYSIEFGAIDEVSMRELSYRVVDQNKLRVHEVRSSVLRSLGAFFSVLNPSNWGHSARTIVTDILTRRIEYEEALRPVNWLTSATIIKDVVYEMHFPYHLEGVGGNLATAVVAQGQKSFAYSWPANDADAIRTVVFHARAWDAPAVMGGIAGVAIFPWLMFMAFKALWNFLKNNVFIGALQTAATAVGKTTKTVFSLPGRVWAYFKRKKDKAVQLRPPAAQQITPPTDNQELLPPPEVEDPETL